MDNVNALETSREKLAKYLVVHTLVIIEVTVLNKVLAIAIMGILEIFVSLKCVQMDVTIMVSVI
jgi:hypothetical protein